MLNIAEYAVAASAPMHVKDAAGELLYDDEARTKPARILFHSPGSKVYSVVESRQTARAIKRMNDNEGKITAATSEERRAEAAEDLATVTIGFENFTYGDGSLAGEDMFKAAYADPGIGFVVKQATKFLADWANFKVASPVS